MLIVHRTEKLSSFFLQFLHTITRGEKSSRGAARDPTPPPPTLTPLRRSSHLHTHLHAHLHAPRIQISALCGGRRPSDGVGNRTGSANSSLPPITQKKKQQKNRALRNIRRNGLSHEPGLHFGLDSKLVFCGELTVSKQRPKQEVFAFE